MLRLRSTLLSRHRPRSVDGRSVVVVKQFPFASAPARVVALGRRNMATATTTSSSGGGDTSVNRQGKPFPASSSAINSSAAAAAPKTKKIVEGSATLTVGSDVFYNNVQVVNRDFSVVALNVFAEQWRLERETQQKWRADGVEGWRKSVLMWDSWGVPAKPVQSAKKQAQQQNKGAAGAVGSSKKVESEANEQGGGDDVDEEPVAHNQVSKKSEAAIEDDTFHILEALSASGLRSIRYAKEVTPSIKKRIVTNDREVAAVESIKKYTEENGPYPEGTKIEPSLADAIDLMHDHRKPGALKFHVVDLDPYGAPSLFLDSAVQCIENGGLLCVTATDTAVLCGSNMEKCRPKYGSVPLHRPYTHEMAIRTLLACINTHANLHGRFIVPLLSLKLDFYIRVFVRVHSDHQKEVNRSTKRLAHVLQSKTTDTFKILPMMVEEHDRVTIPRLDHELFAEDVASGAVGGWMLGGPIWSAPIHNYQFIQACLEKIKRNEPHIKLTYGNRLTGTLAACNEELPDVPLFYSVSAICKSLHCSSPPMEKFQAAIMNAGFRVSQSHHEAGAVKTDAPSDVIWDILRCWVEKHPVSKNRTEDEHSVVSKLLSVKPKLKANFDPPRALREARNARKAPQKGADAAAAAAAPKWHQNPEKFWGPKSRADKRASEVVESAQTKPGSSPDSKRGKFDKQ